MVKILWHHHNVTAPYAMLHRKKTNKKELMLFSPLHTSNYFVNFLIPPFHLNSEFRNLFVSYDNNPTKFELLTGFSLFSVFSELFRALSLFSFSTSKICSLKQHLFYCQCPFRPYHVQKSKHSWVKFWRLTTINLSPSFNALFLQGRSFMW